MSLVWCVAHFFFEFAAWFACGYGLVRSKCAEIQRLHSHLHNNHQLHTNTTNSSELHNIFDAEGNIVFAKNFSLCMI